MEHWEELCPGGLKIVYEDSLFRPGTDSFLLASLPRLKSGLRTMDLGCGTGLLGLLLLQRQRDLQVTGLELQEAAVALAQRCAEENDISDRFTIRQGDLRQLGKAMTQALRGRGGGKPGFQQGRVQAAKSEIVEFFANL